MKKTIIILIILTILIGCSEKAEIEQLKVVTTTNFVTDAVSRIAGDRIQVISLMENGQDPHSFEPSPKDIAAVEKADLIFVNGFDLEEGLLNVLKNVNGDKIISLSSTVNPILPSGEEEDHDDSDNEEHHDSEDEHHHEVDPHTWMSPLNVIKWSDIISESLSVIDEKNREYYSDNNSIYKNLLIDLHKSIEERVASIKKEDRVLITDHDSLAYYAREYGFEIKGTIIPGTSSNADTSTGNLITLIKMLNETGILTLFIGETSGPDMEKLAVNISNELDHPVKIIILKTGSLDKKGSGADTYIKYMDYNTNMIITGLSGD